MPERAVHPVVRDGAPAHAPRRGWVELRGFRTTKSAEQVVSNRLGLNGFRVFPSFSLCGAQADDITTYPGGGAILRRIAQADHAVAGPGGGRIVNRHAIDRIVVVPTR